MESPGTLSAEFCSSTVNDIEGKGEGTGGGVSITVLKAGGVYPAGTADMLAEADAVVLIDCRLTPPTP